MGAGGVHVEDVIRAGGQGLQVLAWHGQVRPLQEKHPTIRPHGYQNYCDSFGRQYKIGIDFTGGFGTFGTVLRNFIREQILEFKIRIMIGKYSCKFIKNNQLTPKNDFLMDIYTHLLQNVKICSSSISMEEFYLLNESLHLLWEDGKIYRMCVQCNLNTTLSKCHRKLKKQRLTQQISIQQKMSLLKFPQTKIKTHRISIHNIFSMKVVPSQKVNTNPSLFIFCWKYLNAETIPPPAQALFRDGGLSIMHPTSKVAKKIVYTLDKEIPDYYAKFYFQDTCSQTIIDHLGKDLTYLQKEDIVDVIERLRDFGAEQTAKYYESYLRSKKLYMWIFPIRYLKFVKAQLGQDKGLDPQLEEYSVTNSSSEGQEEEKQQERPLKVWEILKSQFNREQFFRWVGPHITQEDLSISQYGNKIQISLLNTEKKDKKIRKLELFFNFQKIIPAESKLKAQKFKQLRQKKRPEEPLEIKEGYFVHQKDQLDLKKYKKDLGSAIHMNKIQKSEANKYPFVCLMYHGPANVGDLIESEYEIFQKEETQVKKDPEPKIVSFQKDDFPETKPQVPGWWKQIEPLKRSKPVTPKESKPSSPKPQPKPEPKKTELNPNRPHFKGLGRLQQPNQVSQLFPLTSLPSPIASSLDRPALLSLLENQLAQVIISMKEDFEFPLFSAELILDEDLFVKVFINERIGYILPSCAKQIEKKLMEGLTVERAIQIANLGLEEEGKYKDREFVVVVKGNELWVVGYHIEDNIQEIKQEVLGNVFAPTFTEIEKDSQEFKQIKKQAATKIQKILKVENNFLLSLWSQQKQRLSKWSIPTSHQLLFHGTHTTDPLIICRSGFPQSEFNISEDFFSCIAPNQLSRAFRDSETKLLLCRVLLGNSQELEDYDELSEDPERMNAEVTQALVKSDSVMFELANNKNYIVRNKLRVYPEYIVTIG